MAGIIAAASLHGRNVGHREVRRKKEQLSGSIALSTSAQRAGRPPSTGIRPASLGLASLPGLLNRMGAEMVALIFIRIVMMPVRAMHVLVRHFLFGGCTHFGDVQGKTQGHASQRMISI